MIHGHKKREEQVLELMKLYPYCLRADRDFFTGKSVEPGHVPSRPLHVEVAALAVTPPGGLELPLRHEAVEEADTEATSDESEGEPGPSRGKKMMTAAKVKAFLLVVMLHPSFLLSCLQPNPDAVLTSSDEDTPAEEDYEYREVSPPVTPETPPSLVRKVEDLEKQQESFVRRTVNVIYSISCLFPCDCCQF